MDGRPRGDPLSHLFDADTRVEALAEHVFGATITDRWNAIGDRPNGGYLLAVCLQALRQALPMPDPLAVSAFFLRPTLSGPAEVRTEIVRVGRRVATGEARMLQAGQETARVVATFTDLAAASGRTLVLGTGPTCRRPTNAWTCWADDRSRASASSTASTIEWPGCPAGCRGGRPAIRGRSSESVSRTAASPTRSRCRPSSTPSSRP